MIETEIMVQNVNFTDCSTYKSIEIKEELYVFSSMHKTHIINRHARATMKICQKRGRKKTFLPKKETAKRIMCYLCC